VSIDRSVRILFDEVADLYDEVRPRYPEALVEDILELSGIPAEGRILEVGCGPGTVTVAFARRGYRMVCVELGQRLAALAVENCRAFPGVEIIHSSFEAWELEEHAFDLALSAEAFHWIPPEIGYPKAARALKDSGAIALIWILRRDVETDIYRAIDKVYQEQAPQFENPDKTITPEWLEGIIRENLATFGGFGKVTIRRYPWSQTFTAEEYIKLLKTSSVHHKLDESTREALFEGISAAIERSGGRLVRPFEAMLFLARVTRQTGN
jgi:SAM-dependent methyltransferase